jgi:3-dehydroquinate dehydratase I
MNYKIIVTLGEEELQDYKNPVIKEADILEIRLDLLEISFIKEKLSSILKELAKPILFTYRNPKDSSEASNTSIKFKDIEQVLNQFNDRENYLDIELDQDISIFDSIQKREYIVIYSYHDFSKSISREDMLHWISKKKSPNCIYKFAVTPNNISEEELFLKNLRIISNDFEIIGIAMGEIGVYSRLFGDRFGSFGTYCCIGKPRAPGQVNILALRKIRKEFLNINLPTLEDFNANKNAYNF